MDKKNRSGKVTQDTPNVIGNIAIVFMSLLLIVIGSVMLFTDVVKTIYFCYGAGACLLVWGIWLISRYFLHKEFQQTTNYGFSGGTLVVILGGITLIRAQDVADTIPTYLGMVVLVEGVVMLQNTVQLKNLKGNLWIVSLILSLLSVAASIAILLDLGDLITKRQQILYVILILVELSALLSLCFAGIRTSRYHKENRREWERNMEESEEWLDVAPAKDTISAVTQEETAADGLPSSDDDPSKEEMTVPEESDAAVEVPEETEQEELIEVSE